MTGLFPQETAGAEPRVRRLPGTAFAESRAGSRRKGCLTRFIFPPEMGSCLIVSR